MLVHPLLGPLDRRGKRSRLHAETRSARPDKPEQQANCTTAFNIVVLLFFRNEVKYNGGLTQLIPRANAYYTVFVSPDRGGALHNRQTIRIVSTRPEEENEQEHANRIANQPCTKPPTPL